MIESKYLKDNIQNIQQLLTISALRNFETGQLKKLLRLSKIREYKAGEAIIAESEKDPWFYFLLQGSVRIVKSGEDIARIDQKGEIFGEMRIIDGRKRSASVVAESKVLCLAVDTSATRRISAVGGEDRDEKLDFLVLLYRIFAEYMSIRLRVTNEELIETKKKLKKHEKA